MQDVIVDSKNKVVGIFDNKKYSTKALMSLNPDRTIAFASRFSYLAPSMWSAKNKKSNPVVPDNKIVFEKPTSSRQMCGFKIAEKPDDGSYVVIGTPKYGIIEYDIPKYNSDGSVYHRKLKKYADNIVLINIDNQNLLPYAWDVLFCEEMNGNQVYNGSDSYSSKYDVTEFKAELKKDFKSNKMKVEYSFIRNPIKSLNTSSSHVFYVNTDVKGAKKIGEDKSQHFLTVKDIGGGFKCVKESNKKYEANKGAVDADYNLIIPYEYYSVVKYYPIEEVFLAEMESKLVFVNKKNEQIFKPFFGYNATISEGIIRVQFDKHKYYYKNMDGTRFNEESFTKAEDFNGGKAKVTQKDETTGSVKEGYLYKSGELKWD
jgi:hypothetical protein